MELGKLEQDQLAAAPVNELCPQRPSVAAACPQLLFKWWVGLLVEVFGVNKLFLLARDAVNAGGKWHFGGIPVCLRALRLLTRTAKRLLALARHVREGHNAPLPDLRFRHVQTRPRDRPQQLDVRDYLAWVYQGVAETLPEVLQGDAVAEEEPDPAEERWGAPDPQPEPDQLIDQYLHWEVGALTDGDPSLALRANSLETRFLAHGTKCAPPPTQHPPCPQRR